MNDIDQSTLETLASKLDGLDLDETERAMLDTILERASSYEPEVEGFGFDNSLTYTGQQSGAGLSGTSLKLGGGLGFVTRPNLGFEARMPGDGSFRPPPP